VSIHVRYMGIRPSRARRERSDAVDELTLNERQLHSNRIAMYVMEEEDNLLVDKIRSVSDDYYDSASVSAALV
jgi:hypothetical protein